jgi:hypothetical protein
MTVRFLMLYNAWPLNDAASIAHGADFRVRVFENRISKKIEREIT